MLYMRRCWFCATWYLARRGQTFCSSTCGRCFEISTMAVPFTEVS